MNQTGFCPEEERIKMVGRRKLTGKRKMVGRRKMGLTVCRALGEPRRGVTGLEGGAGRVFQRRPLVPAYSQVLCCERGMQQFTAPRKRPLSWH